MPPPNLTTVPSAARFLGNRACYDACDRLAARIRVFEAEDALAGADLVATDILFFAGRRSERIEVFHEVFGHQVPYLAPILFGQIRLDELLKDFRLTGRISNERHVVITCGNALFDIG